jgi:transcription antitermination factor NusG
MPILQRMKNLSGMSKTKHWYALYTKPRWEKKVHELMLRRGMESYCPLNKVRKKWSDRYKMVEEPLFKSYVFVRITDDEKSNVRLVDGVVNFVYWLGKPAQVREEDILKIKRG